MKIENSMTDAAIRSALGQRVERYRLNEGLSQSDLAQQAGIGKRTLERIEAGAGAEMTSLIRILRVLRLIEGLDLLVPELSVSPIDQLKLQGKQRQRAGHPRKTKSSTASSGSPEAAGQKNWKWGESK